MTHCRREQHGLKEQMHTAMQVLNAAITLVEHASTVSAGLRARYVDNSMHPSTRAYCTAQRKPKYLKGETQRPIFKRLRLYGKWAGLTHYALHENISACMISLLQGRMLITHVPHAVLRSVGIFSLHAVDMGGNLACAVKLLCKVAMMGRDTWGKEGVPEGGGGEWGGDVVGPATGAAVRFLTALAGSESLPFQKVAPALAQLALALPSPVVHAAAAELVAHCASTQVCGVLHMCVGMRCTAHKQKFAQGVLKVQPNPLLCRIGPHMCHKVVNTLASPCI